MSNETTIIQWKNIETGVITQEVIIYLGNIGKCKHVWKSDRGAYYIHRVAGWFDVSKHIDFKECTHCALKEGDFDRCIFDECPNKKQQP